MKRIILIRHGKAAMAGKDHERELDEDGIIQASSLKNKLIELGLNNARIYTSSFKRAIQTIKPFAAINKDVIISEKKELEEIHMPKDEKLSKHQIIEKTQSLLNNNQLYQSMTKIKNPYGDGTSSQQILTILDKNRNIKS